MAKQQTVNLISLFIISLLAVYPVIIGPILNQGQFQRTTDSIAFVIYLMSTSNNHYNNY